VGLKIKIPIADHGAQAAPGGAIPNPRKERPASDRIAIPIFIVINTIRGESN